MTSAPALQSRVSASPGAGTPARRRVVDAPTRMFHWLFAASFAGAYLTADGERWRALHVTLGYTLAGLLAFRVLYGLIGPRHARLGPMVRRLMGVPAWLRSLADAVRDRSIRGIGWRQGRSLLTGLAVVALLALAAPLTLSGYGTYADWGHALGGDWLEEVHEFLGEAFLAVALAHVALIAGSSALGRKNQATPMLTGYVDGTGPDLVRRNRRWLAGLLLLAVVGFAGWQWGATPHGLAPTKGAVETHRHHDDD